LLAPQNLAIACADQGGRPRGGDPVPYFKANLNTPSPKAKKNYFEAEGAL